MCENREISKKYKHLIFHSFPLLAKATKEAADESFSQDISFFFFFFRGGVGLVVRQKMGKSNIGSTLVFPDWRANEPSGEVGGLCARVCVRARACVCSYPGVRRRFYGLT